MTAIKRLATPVTAASTTENAAMFIRRVFRNKGLNIDTYHDGANTYLGFALHPDGGPKALDGIKGVFQLSHGRVYFTLYETPTLAGLAKVKKSYSEGISHFEIAELPLDRSIKKLGLVLENAKTTRKEILSLIEAPSDKAKFEADADRYVRVFISMRNALAGLARSEAKRI